LTPSTPTTHTGARNRSRWPRPARRAPDADHTRHAIGPPPPPGTRDPAAGPARVAPVDPIAELADAAETHRLDPGHREMGEPVVQLRDVDVGRGHRRALPHRVGARSRTAEQEVVA